MQMTESRVTLRKPPFSATEVSMRIALTALLVAALAVPGLAQLKPAPKVGDKSMYRVKYTMDIQGMDVTVTLGTAIEVTKVDEGLVARTANGKDLKVLLGGQELDPTPEIAPMSVVLNKDGSAKSFSGGIEGVDALRMFITTHFFAPVAELKEGEAAKSRFEKNSVFPQVGSRGHVRRPGRTERHEGAQIYAEVQGGGRVRVLLRHDDLDARGRHRPQGRRDVQEPPHPGRRFRGERQGRDGARKGLTSPYRSSPASVQSNGDARSGTRRASSERVSRTGHRARNRVLY